MRRDILRGTATTEYGYAARGYGHAGYPLLMFPTAAADYLEYERFHLVDAIKDLIEAGKIRAYSINSVNKYSLLNRESHPGWKSKCLNATTSTSWKKCSR
jgi:esterase/lipase superfamily enzyme